MASLFSYLIESVEFRRLVYGTLISFIHFIMHSLSVLLCCFITIITGSTLSFQTKPLIG